MSDPAVRSALGEALEPTRDQWIIQGHIGSTWQDGQYVRTRELNHVRPAFEDLLARLRTDHVELGMIHYVDACDEFRAIMDGPFIEYVRELLAAGKIGHIGLSTHNPEVALLACDEPEIEVIMFSLNPAFDMMPASEDLEDLFGDYENVAGDGIEPVRARLYARAEEKDVALTVMKGYAGGRLLSADASPFGVALTPVQCIHYALTRPAVASVMVGVETVEQLKEALAYEGATAAERDYASVLAGRPSTPTWPVHLLRPLRAVHGGHQHRTFQQVRRLGRDGGRGARLGGGPLQGHGRHGRRLHRLRRLRAPLPLRRADHRAHGKDGGALRLLNEPANFGVFSIRAG